MGGHDGRDRVEGIVGIKWIDRMEGKDRLAREWIDRIE
jgi:hypothetical protein